MKLLLQYPLKDVSISQGYGAEKTIPSMLPTYQGIGLKGHNGLDMHAPDGTPVLAAHDGTITYAGLDGSNGNLIVIMTDEMYDYEGKQSYFKTLYCHLKTGTYKVTAGNKVKAGQVIALADNTGMSTGSHLHFGLKPVLQGEESWQWFNLVQDNGYNGAIDPIPYLPSSREFKNEMKKGDYNDDVKKLQALFLRNNYMSPIPENEFGYYGNKTSRAVLAFQLDYCTLSWYEKNILRGTRVGPKTLDKLNQLYYKLK